MVYTIISKAKIDIFKKIFHFATESRWRFMHRFFCGNYQSSFQVSRPQNIFSCILGCPQDFNFARPFHPFSPVSTQPYQNGRAKLKSCGHPRIKLKKCSVDIKASLKIATEKSIHKTSSNTMQVCVCCTNKCTEVDINHHFFFHSTLQQTIQLLEFRGVRWCVRPGRGVCQQAQETHKRAEQM